MAVPKIGSNHRPDASELLKLAVRVAAEGAELARRTRAESITQVSTKSTDTDVVTAGDHAVDRHIAAALAAARPGDPILTEESGATAGDGAVRWILDPIDGTVNYLYGVPYYGVSLAAEVDGEIVAAVVHNAATGESYTAVRGQGAFAGGRRLRGTAVTSLAQALVATGFGYDAARRAHQGRVVGALLPRIRDIRRFE
jgi:myo-inositol-1(or 4)-monophosphatase